ncbi:hypothetical protein [Thalassospira xiamenensis]|uniref:Uncharacterized protein n=1 Tax=Thalassospira xiamenensis TaxID=220697 RepID=A0A285TXJ0_9PROT|nr:hypothetical protein [Thalassospira xiamenensis]SOC30522.1 hypothetical protein SAMN05428964_10973 [Thalassospira xiamenensis]
MANVSTAKNEAVTTVVTVNSVDDFRAMFAAELPSAASDHLFASLDRSLDEVSASADQQRMMRVQAYVTDKSAALSQDDQEYAAQFFPMQVSQTSGSTKTITSKETIGPGAMPQLIDVDELIFDGGALAYDTTQVTIKAASVTVKQNCPGVPYHIGILGSQGPNGTDGSAGANGSKGQDGQGGTGSAGAGDAGKGGEDGNVGNPGYPGVPTQVASFTFKTITIDGSNPLSLYIKQGDGGQGGSGGQGGDGGSGGGGGTAHSSGCGDLSDGGDGGAGGNGGDGGEGGQGGQGAPAPGAVVLSMALADKAKISINSEAGVGGPGGSGGAGGNAGAGGPGGNGTKNRDHGPQGSSGIAGNDGATGIRGQNGPATSVVPNYI